MQFEKKEKLLFFWGPRVFGGGARDECREREAEGTGAPLFGQVDSGTCPHGAESLSKELCII